MGMRSRIRGLKDCFHIRISRLLVTLASEVSYQCNLFLDTFDRTPTCTIRLFLGRRSHHTNRYDTAKSFSAIGTISSVCAAPPVPVPQVRTHIDLRFPRMFSFSSSAGAFLGISFTSISRKQKFVSTRPSHLDPRVPFRLIFSTSRPSTSISTTTLI